MEILNLKSKLTIYEYQNYILKKLIDKDYRVVELAYKTRQIYVSQEVKDYIKGKKSRKFKNID